MHLIPYFALILVFLNFATLSCEKRNDATDLSKIEPNRYFPPKNTADWQTMSPASLNWNLENLDTLYHYLFDNGTRAFLILKEGKIVVEKYWGDNILGTGPFTSTSQWYWASAGKSLTSFLFGLAQQEGLLHIEAPTSEYLGKNWTSMAVEKENLITLRHHLTMTTGLDYTVGDTDCTDPACLQYLTDAGLQWYYHNAPYTLLGEVIETASGIDYNSFTDQQLESKTGIKGHWITSNQNRVYWSSPRDMARFGLLIMNRGDWDQKPILADKSYFQDMISPSQGLNPSYGYLWWLNGQGKIVPPGSEGTLPLDFSPSAPTDMITAAGKNGQFLDVIPSMDLIVVRMGEAPDNSLVPIRFHNEMWNQLTTVVKN